MLRSWKQYNFDVSEGGITRSGIKGACVRPDVKSFRVLDQVGVGIMHDLLEGYGFICFSSGSNDIPKPQCVLCSVILSNEAMKPAKLIRHLESKHKEFNNKPTNFFIRKVKASYLVAFRIAKCKKPYNIGETLIKPCLLDVTSKLLGPSAAKKMNDLPLSNDTISRRINDISVDIEEQVIDKIKLSKWFSIQLDESTDVSQMAIWLCYVRFIDFQTSELCEDLLCCCELPSHTTGSEVFKRLNEYIKKIQLNWENCVSVCTDGAASMTGKYSGVVSRIKNVANLHFVHIHCIIHRQHLVAKKMSPDLNEVLTEAVKIINFIKCNALNSRLFLILCEEMGSEHSHLLMHVEVRWLSRETNELDIDSNIKITIENHLQSLYDTFEDYYPVNQDPRDGYLWVQNPFLTNSQHKLCLKEQELLLEISSDIGLQSKFKTMSVTKFWIELKDEYYVLFEKAMKILLPFSSTYLCEAGFSGMTHIKTKTRNRLDATHSLRVALTTTVEPRFDKIVKTKQAQRSD
ncbi:zinc finger MYM-type protein 6-like [Metopolophium dirhodum]|uniref:zinc finger MYM-type protein 6-like n=1 Tax=Metopolophium dirhodum TaxID=44670 RepID=UPI00299060CC|nr:zinc finger MYM-type protein 6-like [Metopolophium dirhodum]